MSEFPQVSSFAFQTILEGPPPPLAPIGASMEDEKNSNQHAHKHLCMSRRNSNMSAREISNRWNDVLSSFKYSFSALETISYVVCLAGLTSFRQNRHNA